MVDRTLEDDLDAETAIVTDASVPRREPPEPRPAERLGRYEILDELGVGGMGRVLRARDPTLDRDVALKVLRVGRGSQAAGSGRARLIREAQALAQLSHPNVAKVFDVEASGELVYIAMELIDGETLGAWLRGVPTRNEILATFAAAGRGLAAAHGAGLVHRDFKPHNVMVGGGRVRVLDFGLVRGVAEGSASESDAPLGPGASMSSSQRISSDDLTHVGAVMGTPAYMAPEQHCGETPDARTDQFAFCVTLFEALAGARPFVAPNIEALYDQKQRGALQNELPANISRAVRAAIVRGLSPERVDRWPSMDALLARLSPPRVQRHGPVFLSGIGAVAASSAVAWVMFADPDHCGEVVESTRWWTPDAAAQVRQVVAAGKAAESADEVDAALSRYADEWAAARLEACESSRAAESRTAEHRAVCLDGLGRTAGALVRILSEGDEDTVANAGRAAAALPPLARCHGEGPDADAPPRDDPGVVDVRARLAESHAYSLAGNYAAAEASSRGALATARELGHERLIAEASHRFGRDLGWRGQYPESERALREAYFVAAQVGDRRTAFEAADSLIFVVGDAQGRYDDALDWARLAQAELEHLPPDPATQGRLLHSMGLALARHGDVEESLESLQRAVDVMAEGWGPDDPRLGIPYNNLANSLMAAGRLEEAQDAYAFAHDLTIERYGPDHPQAAVSLGNLGDVLMRQGDADAAVELLEECLAIVRGALRPEHLHVAETEYRLGKVLRAAGRNEDAIAHLEIAQASFAELEGYASYTHPLFELGLARLAIGRPRDAASVLNRAIAVAADEGSGTDAETLAELRFAAARAIWAVGEDPMQARRLATQARDARVADGLPSDEIDRWLSEHARSG